MNKAVIQHKNGKLARVCEIQSDGKVYSTPTYFPSLSSTKTRFSLTELFYLLKYNKYPRLLLSAYDIDKLEEKEKIKQSIAEFRKHGILFLDSGVFESDNRGDKSWDLKSYKSVVSQMPTDIFTAFDILPYLEKFQGDEDYTKKVFQSAIESSAFCNGNVFLPILHGKSIDHLLAVTSNFIRNYSGLCSGIAVSERDCGKSIIERAETLSEIRHILDIIDDRYILHVLGCGNPVSMLVYSYCGSDSFDSLDWIDHILDPGDNTIKDFSHLDLINCKCRICTNPKLDKSAYLERALLHNLQYYHEFVIQTQNMIRYDNLRSFLKTILGEEILETIDKF